MLPEYKNSTELAPDEMQTVTETGKPVSERITTIDAARAVATALKDAAFEESVRRARLKAHIDGNPPMTPSRLRELGMGQRINMNFLEMRAILDQKASAHFELFFEVPTLIDLAPQADYKRDVMAGDYAAIISQEFTKTLFDWDGFLPMMDKVRRESDAYGLGVAMWVDEWDWKPKAFRRGNFTPDPMADYDLDKLPVFTMRDSMRPGELWRVIENEEVAIAEGWNPAAVKRLLVRIYRTPGTAQNTSDPYQTSEWESLQQRIRNNDSSIQSKEFESVRVTHELVAEIDDNRVSHYIFPEEPDPGRDDFLFRSRGRFGRMCEVLWWLPYNYGDSFVRSTRGLASMIQPHCDLSNRFLCQVFEAGFLNGSLIVQPKTTIGTDDLELTRMGPLTVMPAGLEAVQTSFTPRLIELTQLRDLSQSIMKNNTGVFRQHPELFAENQAAKTAYQVSQEVAKEARMEKANIAYDYIQIQRLYREMYRRLTRKEYVNAPRGVAYPGVEEARDFIDRCRKRGVPDKYLFNPKVWDINITRAIGFGSWGVKLDISNQIMSMRSLFDEAGQINAVRDALAVRVGFQNVDRYRPMKSRDEMSSNEHTIAMLENNDMVEGRPVVVGSDQYHSIHFRIHGVLLNQLLQALEQQPPETLGLQQVGQQIAVFSAVLPHIEQTLQYMAGDPAKKELVAQGVELLRQGAAALQTMQQTFKQLQAQEMKRLQEAQDGAVQGLTQRELMEAQIKQREIELKAENERLKQDSLNRMRADKTREQLAMRRMGQEEQMRLQAERQGKELEMAATKLQADIDLRRTAQAQL